MEIVFFNNSKDSDFENSVYPVKPASDFIPEWYMNIPLTGDGKELGFVNGVTNATVRKCVPFLDAMTAGYIIQLANDVHVSRQEATTADGEFKSDVPYYSWGMGNEIQFHDFKQAFGHPGNKAGYPIPKFISSWSIFTPPGYSCFFTHPFNRSDLPFRIMDGIVDTDEYHTPVNFPFTLVDPNFKGLIKAGTPIAQIIPFKRDSWKMSLGVGQEAKYKKETNWSIQSLRRLAHNGYRKLFWAKKEFK